MKKDKALNIVLLFTLAAIGVHIYLSTHFYSLKLGLGGGNAVCNVNDYMNCDAVSASQYAALFGVPIALWGAFTNLIALMFFTFSRLNLTQDNEKTARYGFLMALGIFITSLVMGFISMTRIGNLCIFCATIYAISLFQLIAAYKSTPISTQLLAQDVKEIFTAQRWILGSLVAIPVLAFLINSMILDSYGYGNLKRMVDEKVDYWSKAQTQVFDTTKGLILHKGSSDPIMTIVEFADFRCHHCKDAYPALHAFASARPDVRLIFKPFPLDGTCNSAITGGDGVSCALASLAHCSEKIQQKGWQVHHFIFDNQNEFRGLNADSATEYVCKGNQLDCEAVKSCMKSDETIGEIKAMAAEGEKARIQGTPTIFVNSKLLSSGQLMPVLEGAYKNLKN